MDQKQICRVLAYSTAALAVPILGQLFVEGWNWGLGEFVFAWVFFNILGLTYIFVTRRIIRRRLRILAGIAVVAAFAFVWVMLATG